MYPDPLRRSPLRKNRLRELLDSGSPSLGTHLLSTWPTITELVGQTGHWDYVEFVASCSRTSALLLMLWSAFVSCGPSTLTTAACTGLGCDGMLGRSRT